MRDEFYVGYVREAPDALGRTIARAAAGILLAGSVVSAVLILDQPPFSPGRFEYGQYREYAGVIEEWPYPTLVTDDATLLLAGSGKHGVSEGVKGLHGRSVRLSGALIERAPDQMLEVLPGSVQPGAEAAQPLRSTIGLGQVTLRGEIVDTKCYLGVMNPGEGKVHGDCAVRCISGGLPPALVARDATGGARILLLVGMDGRALNREVLGWVGSSVEVTGDMVRIGSVLVLRAEPSRFRRVVE